MKINFPDKFTILVSSPGRQGAGEEHGSSCPMMSATGDLASVSGAFFDWLNATNQTQSKELTVMVNGIPILALSHEGKEWRKGNAG